MKKVIVFALIAIATFWGVKNYLYSERATPFDDQVTSESVWSNPDIANSLTNDIDTDFKIDINRLYDLAYENDQRLADFARSINKSPACVIAIAKLHIDNLDTIRSSCKNSDPSTLNESFVVLPGTYETVCRTLGGDEVCRRVKVADHPYEKYSSDELGALATTSPEAAIILARRLEDDDSSERLYEQAVALSGRPGPLEEWMLHRNVGGLVYVNGQLDVEKAIVGLEIYLTTARLGYAEDAVAEYVRVLRSENVDIDEIQQRADARFSRISATRKSLLAEEWEG